MSLLFSLFFTPYVQFDRRASYLSNIADSYVLYLEVHSPGTLTFTTIITKVNHWTLSLTSLIQLPRVPHSIPWQPLSINAPNSSIILPGCELCLITSVTYSVFNTSEPAFEE